MMPKWIIEQIHSKPHKVHPNRVVYARVIDPVVVDERTLRKVKIHPLLADGMTQLLMKLDAVHGSPYLLSGKQIANHYSNPATNPPMNNIRIVTRICPDPVTIVNPKGVTVGEVLDAMQLALLQPITHSMWGTWSPTKQWIVGECFKYNRKYGEMPEWKKGILFADLLGKYTVFGGITSSFNLRSKDRKEMGKECEWPGTFFVRWHPSGHLMTFPASWECS